MANLESAKRVPVLDLHGAFIRRIDLNGTILRNANLSGADGSNASFQNADFEGARLDGTILRGADLTGAKNLTMKQLASAIIDERTRLPTYIDRQQLLNEVLRQTEGAHS
jgi:uncharacterized protein YjbI with pentapeptide repeats